MTNQWSQFSIMTCVFIVMNACHFSFLQVENTFFVTNKASPPKQYKVSDNGVNCNRNYLTSRFTARTFPSKDYPKPMYLFSSSSHMTLSDNIDDAFVYLTGYFYVSETSKENTSAIYYRIGNGKNGRYMEEFSTTSPDGNWTGNVVYVISHQIHKGMERFNRKNLFLLNIEFFPIFVYSTIFFLPFR